MSKHVLDVGNCSPDHATLSRFLKKHFEVEVYQADHASDALKILASKNIDLILVNRKLDIDYSDGIDVIRQIKSDANFSLIPTMLITNYEEHQDVAVELGAERGFGKLQYNEPATLERLNRILA
jgi:CheY-like chemotaxis protein